jgi:microsomal dipeptidase-like Zn-dependent dipeptidase
VLIDVSQLSGAAFDQVLALSRAPVIASHSDVRGLVDNSRNLSDSQLATLKAKKGVIAINAFSAYLRARSPETLKRVTNLQREFGGPALSVEQRPTMTVAITTLSAPSPRPASPIWSTRSTMR